MQAEILRPLGIRQVRNAKPERMGMKDGNVEPRQSQAADLHHIAHALMLDLAAQRPSLRQRFVAEESHEGTADAGCGIQLIAHGLPERIEVKGGFKGAVDAAVLGIQGGGLESNPRYEFGPGVVVIDPVKVPP